MSELGPNPGFFDLVGNVRAMRRLKPDPVPLELLREVRFGIPSEYGVVVTMPIGFPLGRFGPVRRKPAADVTYFDRWGRTSA
jgi:nitroreductase